MRAKYFKTNNLRSNLQDTTQRRAVLVLPLA